VRCRQDGEAEETPEANGSDAIDSAIAGATCYLDLGESRLAKNASTESLELVGGDGEEQRQELLSPVARRFLVRW
jgi:hypothetical protein